MGVKTIHVLNVRDGVYAIYRLSNRARCKIQIIRAGKAFDMNEANFSKQMLRDCKAFNIDVKDERYYYFTAKSYKDFLNQVYLKSKQVAILRDTIEVPSVPFEIIEEHYNREEQKKEDKEKFDIIMKNMLKHHLDGVCKRLYGKNVDRLTMDQRIELGRKLKEIKK